MKKIVIFLISAILSMNCVNLYAQTEMNPTDGCSFRFVLEDPLGLTGWAPGAGITVTVDGVEYGLVNLPWGTFFAEETLLLPSGEIQFLWIGDIYFHPSSHYFEIYNSLDELIYTSPEQLPGELFFTYQNECNVGINDYSSSLQLYPNPANNVVYLAGADRATVKVFNSMGQLINNYHNVNSINVSSYKAGIYIFSVITNEGNTKAFKVLITK
jgi:WD40 repeat protein